MLTLIVYSLEASGLIPFTNRHVPQFLVKLIFKFSMISYYNFTKGQILDHVIDLKAYKQREIGKKT